MSLPVFSTQAELFSTAGLSSKLFAETDRYRLFAQKVYPALAGAREALEKCYCADNGRVAIERGNGVASKYLIFQFSCRVYSRDRKPEVRYRSSEVQ